MDTNLEVYPGSDKRFATQARGFLERVSAISSLPFHPDERVTGEGAVFAL
jgi:hypothetical protein